MSHVVTTHPSGLVLATEAQDEQTITRALNQLDARLFLSREIDHSYGTYVWRVLHWLSDDAPAVPVCDWRDERGRPLPLSFALLEKLKSQYGRGAEIGKAIDDHNQRRLERIDRDIDDVVQETGEAFERFLRPTRSTLLPRGPHLRRSRDKRRARGEKC